MSASLRLCSLFLATSLLVAPIATAQESSTSFQSQLMPEPASLRAGSGALPIDSHLTVSLTRTRSPRLQAAVLRTLKRLEDKTGQPLPRAIPANSNSAVLTIDVAADGPGVIAFGEDESYSLTSTPSSIHIQAPTTLGAMHALETLVQLVQPAGSGYVVPAVTVEDRPRFGWRGLMIDCGRHFEPLDVLKRNIDAMAAVKLNVFHWHLTDDQGFRIESKVFPKLTALGSDGLFYTQEDARDLVRYAMDRGIRVVPEFEMPGHSAAWLVAYPELNSGTQPEGIRREFGISDIALDPTRDETYQFIGKFLREMTTVFPDQYIHVGGDETPAPDWKTNPRILAFKKAHDLKDNDALQAYFNQRVLKILTGLNRRMVGWDEILNPALPKSIVIQSWRGEASLAKGAEEGYQGVLSAPYYLDAMKPAGVHYLADPIPAGTKLTPEQQKLILGGEVCMWAEHLDQRTVDSRIWPRTAAMAERFWSPREVRDVDSMYRRLLPVSIELESLGLDQITSEARGLRELVDSENISALQTFAQAFEPVSFSERYQQQHTSQLTPLTSFVDAVRPDPPIRHQVELDTRILLANPKSTSPAVAEARGRLLQLFRSLAASIPEVQEQMRSSPRLQPMETRAGQLLELTRIGEQAMGYLTGTQQPAADWKSSSNAAIATARQPSAIVRFTFLDPLEAMVDAVP